MRDILVAMLVFGSLPFVLRWPFAGVMVWTWISLMNPHRLAYGFIVDMPVALIVAVTLFLSYGISKEPKKIPVSAEVAVLAVFIIWMFITTINAMYPWAAWGQWDKVWRIQLILLLTIMLTTTPIRVHLLVWTICVSLGFYGFKGGIWFLMSGGAHQVYGPRGTFIGGNNELGLALIIIVPLLWYLIQNTRSKLVQIGLYFGAFFTLVAIVGTHSRGALVGLLVMAAMFLVKSKKRVIPIIFGSVFIALAPNFLPDHWFGRMETIQTYEEDKSAMGRIYAWKNAIALAQSSIFGGGFEAIALSGGTDAHSIYFEVLGEHGYFGLALFLLLGVLTWKKASKARKLARGRSELKWAEDLMAMMQVSLAGYATAGAFLGLAYFDLIYLLLSLVWVTEKLVQDRIVGKEARELGVKQNHLVRPS